MSRIGRLDRGIALMQRNKGHDSSIAQLKMSGVRHIADSNHTKAQRALAVRSRCQRTAPALELAP